MRPLPRLQDQPLLQEAGRWPGAAPSAPGASETPLRTHCRRTGQSTGGAGPGLDQRPKLDSGCELMGGREGGGRERGREEKSCQGGRSNGDPSRVMAREASKTLGCGRPVRTPSLWLASPFCKHALRPGWGALLLSPGPVPSQPSAWCGGTRGQQGLCGACGRPRPLSCLNPSFLSAQTCALSLALGLTYSTFLSLQEHWAWCWDTPSTL